MVVQVEVEDMVVALQDLAVGSEDMEVVLVVDLEAKAAD